jgi:hypothetical protein
MGALPIRHSDVCARPQTAISRSAGPTWENFPQGLRDDIDAYCERIGKRHKTVSGRIFRLPGYLGGALQGPPRNAAHASPCKPERSI